jgi:hypothetical protein
MRNRWLVNLLLLILVITLGALMRHDLEQERQAATLTGLLPESVTEISIERSGHPAIRLAQGVDGWRMDAPYRVPAAAGRITQLAGIAATQVYRSLPQGADREELGLNADSLRLTLNGLVLRFGDLDPIAQHRYVAVGDQVHLIGDGFYHHLIASAEDYVDRKLLPAGFRAASGTLDGKSLTSEQLAELDELSAETVEPLGSELVGRLLSLTSELGERSPRFLVSADGRIWSRLDLRLRYLLATPPPWAVAETVAEPAAKDPETGDRDR